MTNTLAYFAVVSVMEIKSSRALTPEVNVTKLFSLLLILWNNKLECSYLAKPFQPSTIFATKAEA
jgi:hypothetical protein